MRALAVAVLFMGASLAGCLAGDEPLDHDAVDPDENVTLPDDYVPPPKIVTEETNKTVEGTGGKPHIHDYWNGRSRVVILERDLYTDWIPVFPRGDTSNVFSTDLEMPPGVLVYEGTGKVELLVKELDPSLTGLQVAIKTAMDRDFREPIPLTPGTPLEYDIDPEEADMPHATNSLWEFRFYAHGANPAMTTTSGYFQGTGAFNVTLTVVKARDVANWPGHPDFYDGKGARVVLDTTARTEQVGVNDAWLYGSDANNVQAERLISMGTSHLMVHVNVLNAQAATGEPEGYFLEYRNATGDWERIRDKNVENYTSKEQVFHIPVFPSGLDSPYAQQSRWQFRLMAVLYATPGTPVVGPIGLCPGCLPYTVDYTIKVVAYPHEDGAMDEMDM